MSKLKFIFYFILISCSHKPKHPEAFGADTTAIGQNKKDELNLSRGHIDDDLSADPSMYNDLSLKSKIHWDIDNNLKITINYYYDDDLKKSIFIDRIHFFARTRIIGLAFDSCSDNLKIISQPFEEINWSEINLKHVKEFYYHSDLKGKSALDFDNPNDTNISSFKPIEIKKLWRKYLPYFKLKY